MRIGLAIPPVGLPIDVCTDIVQRAEERGFDSLWMGEAWGTETFTMVSALLARSQHIHIGTSIVSIYLRPPTLTAMQAATIDLVAPGRARLGLGVSTRNVNNLHGVPWDYPISRMREYVTIVQKALAGEHVAAGGRFYRPQNFQLGMPVPGPIPIYFAAVNPQMLQLAGEIADGVLLAWLPARQVPQSLAEIARGAERAGRTLADIDIGCYLHTVVTDDRERTFKQLRRILFSYCQANTYIQGFRHFGYGDILEQVHDRQKAGDRAGAEAAVAERMVEELYVFGTADECRAHINRFRQGGVQLPIVASLPSSQTTGNDLFALMGAFAP
jgi:probable F420-dependent oxidoreductase